MKGKVSLSASQDKVIRLHVLRRAQPPESYPLTHPGHASPQAFPRGATAILCFVRNWYKEKSLQDSLEGKDAL